MPAREEGRLRFIMDAEANSVRWHWERYGQPRGIVFATWLSWSARDKWLDARERFWNETRARLEHEAQKKLSKLNAKFMEKMFAIADPLLDKLMPITDADGKLVLGPDGKPQFAIPFKSYEGAMSALGGFLDRLAVRTGDVSSRVAQVREGEDPQRSTVTDPVSHRRVLEPKDYRALAITMMRLQDENQPEPDEDVLAALPEEEESVKEKAR